MLISGLSPHIFIPPKTRLLKKSAQVTGSESILLLFEFEFKFEFEFEFEFERERESVRDFERERESVRA